MGGDEPFQLHVGGGHFGHRYRSDSNYVLLELVPDRSKEDVHMLNTVADSQHRDISVEFLPFDGRAFGGAAA